MEQKIIVFDFATSGDLEHICAAVIHGPERTHLWPEKRNEQGLYDLRLKPTVLMDIALFLHEALAEGHAIYGWGTLGYDLRLLYKESPAKEEALGLALNHADLLFMTYCLTGSMISLSTASKAHQIYLDPKFGEKVPTLWAGTSADQTLVVDNLIQTVTAIHDLAMVYHKTKSISWINASSGEIITTKGGADTNFPYLYPSFFLPQPMLVKRFYEMTSWVRQAGLDLAGEKDEDNVSSRLPSENNGKPAPSLRDFLARGGKGIRSLRGNWKGI